MAETNNIVLNFSTKFFFLQILNHKNKNENATRQEFIELPIL